MREPLLGTPSHPLGLGEKKSGFTFSFIRISFQEMMNQSNLPRMEFETNLLNKQFSGKMTFQCASSPS